MNGQSDQKFIFRRLTPHPIQEVTLLMRAIIKSNYQSLVQARVRIPVSVIFASSRASLWSSVAFQVCRLNIETASVAV